MDDRRFMYSGQNTHEHACNIDELRFLSDCHIISLARRSADVPCIVTEPPSPHSYQEKVCQTSRRNLKPTHDLEAPYGWIICTSALLPLKDLNLTVARQMSVSYELKLVRCGPLPSRQLLFAVKPVLLHPSVFISVLLIIRLYTLVVPSSSVLRDKRLPLHVSLYYIKKLTGRQFH